MSGFIRPFFSLYCNGYLNMNLIPTSEALRVMRSFDAKGYPVKFDIEVLALNNKKGTAGRVLRYENVNISGLKKQTVAEKHKEKLQSDSGSAKAPDHSTNLTLNIYHKLTNQTRKIHLFQITRLNGHKVL